MEVPNATVLPIYTAGILTAMEVWAPTQAAGSGWALTAAAKASGLAESAIKVHTTLLGGGFGRKIETDFITTAVKTAVGIKKPVKVIWPREEDFGHDWYRPFAVARVRALLAADKTIGAWSFRTVTQSIMQRFGWWAPGWGADSTAIECATTKTGVPYATAAKAVEWVPLNVSIPTGFWRSVGHSGNVFYLESFLGPRGAPAWSDPYAVPNLAKDLSGLPPAFIAVAGHDPLHDDGVIFADKLGEAGVPVTLRDEPALAHSFMRARHHSAPAMAAFKAIVAAIAALAHEGSLPS